MQIENYNDSLDIYLITAQRKRPSFLASKGFHYITSARSLRKVSEPCIIVVANDAKQMSDWDEMDAHLYTLRSMANCTIIYEN